MQAEFLSGLNILNPWAEFDLPRPGTAVLAVNMKIGLCNGVGFQRPVQAQSRRAFVTSTSIDAAVDDKLCNVNIFRRH